MEKHKIDWLNKPGYKGQTWNPFVGCTKVSPACKNCYAEKMAGRLASIGSTSYYGNVTRFENMAGGNEFEDPDQWKYKGWNGKTHFVESAIDKPLHWKKPRMIFVCSMSDLFHETVEFNHIDAVWNTAKKCPQHIFIILTKRPERMAEFVSEVGHFNYGILPNIWLNVTAENQKEANKRIPILLDIPAAKRGISIEPMLSGMDISDYLHVANESGFHDYGGPFSGSKKLDWVICGGESGHNARPMHPDWVRSIRDQCKETGTPFFFKQFGEWVDGDNCPEEYKMWCGPSDGYHRYSWDHDIQKGDRSINRMYKVGRSKSGSKLDGQHHKEFPV